MKCCDKCGARLEGRWEGLTPGIVRTLIKIWTRVIELDRNEIHLQRDLDLDNNAYNNAQKLRFFALIAHVADKPGYWLITHRGSEFIHDRQRVNKQVKIFRNHIQERSTEMVGILDVLKCGERTWPVREDFITATEPVQERLWA